MKNRFNPPPKPRGLEKLTAGERARVVALYHEGVTTKHLAARFGVTAEWLRKVLFPAYGITLPLGRRIDKF